MSCTNCGSKSCSCSDNCPNKTSDITVFDGQLNILQVPCGASLNDIIALLEAYTTNMVNELSGMVDSIVIPEPNPIGLPAGTYGIQQVITAILTELDNLNNSITNNAGEQVYVNITQTTSNTLLATPSGGVAPYTYLWSIADSRLEVTTFGPTVNPSVQLQAVADTGDALVKVRVTDANGRQVNDTFYIRINF